MLHDSNVCVRPKSVSPLRTTHITLFSANMNPVFKLLAKINNNYNCLSTSINSIHLPSNNGRDTYGSSGYFLYFRIIREPYKNGRNINKLNEMYK